MTIKDTFGNVLPPGTYFTYATGSRYAITRVGRVPRPGEKLRVAARMFGSAFDVMQGARPSNTVLALDPVFITDHMKALLG